MALQDLLQRLCNVTFQTIRTLSEDVSDWNRVRLQSHVGSWLEPRKRLVYWFLKIALSDVLITGLGKNNQGIVDAIKPKLKFDQTGVGHNR